MSAPSSQVLGGLRPIALVSCLGALLAAAGCGGGGTATATTPALLGALDGTCLAPANPSDVQVLPNEAVRLSIAADWPSAQLIVSANGVELENVGPGDTQRQSDLKAMGKAFWIPENIDTNRTPPAWTVHVELPPGMRTAPLTLAFTSRKPNGTSSSSLSTTITTDVHVQAPAWNRVQLAWRDRTGETGYVVERKDVGGQFAPVGQVGANASGYTDQSTLGTTPYSYRVTAIGCGKSGIVDVTTPLATGIDIITLSRPGSGTMTYSNPLVTSSYPGAIVSSVTNVALDSNNHDGSPPGGGGVPLGNIRHTDSKGTQRSTGSSTGCPAAIKIAPQDSSATFDGTTVSGSWTADAVCINNVFLNDFITLKIAWHGPP